MGNFGSYKGEEFLNLNLPQRQWLVQGIMREKDSVVLVGSEKSGKSVLTQQLICSLTSQHPFLDRYEVVKPCKVTYLQLEGELEDTQDRFKRMLNTIDFDPEMFQIIFSPPLELNTAVATRNLIDTIVLVHRPDILIIDPLYFAFRGDLSDNNAVRQFIGNVRILKEELGCAILLIHHTHKIRYNFKTGNILEEGDEAMYGSKFLKAYPDYILLLVYDKQRQVRILTCETQRSGDVIKSSILKLIEPNPLYFEEIGINDVDTKENTILSILSNPNNINGLNIYQLHSVSNLSRGAIYRTLKQLIKTKQVRRVSKQRPVKYCVDTTSVSLKKPKGQ